VFGLFKNRKRYNGDVDTKLNNEYQIATRDNPMFPEVMAYLGLIDEAWNGKMSEAEAAIFIAVLYHDGIRQAGYHMDAQALGDRIRSIAAFSIQTGQMRADRAARFVSVIDSGGIPR